MARTYGGVVFCYFREARGDASRALKAAGIEGRYHSSASLRSSRDTKPTPRYIFHGATKEQIEMLEQALGPGTEMYFDPE